MIDIPGRKALAENRKTETLVKGMKDSVIEAVKSMSEKDSKIDEIKNSMDLKFKDMESKTKFMLESIKASGGDASVKDLEGLTNMSLGDVFQNLVKDKVEKKSLERLINIDATSEKSLNKLDQLGRAIVMLYEIIKKPFTLPKILQVKGQVEVTQNAPTKITNLAELEKYFKELGNNIKLLAQAASMAPAPQIKLTDFPKIEIPKFDNSKLEELLKELVDKINTTKEIKFPREIEVSNFPRQMVPQPVTNFNLNGLQGFAKSTSVTVGTTLTELPAYGELNNRRTMILYNNGSQTIYIGGSDVTASNGLPIPSSTYSPPIDAGVNLKVYGLTASGSSDVRVLEVSSNQTASKVQ